MMKSPNYTFFRRDINQTVAVDEEVWGWEAHFDDGSVLKQFGDDGMFHQFAEIDQSRLAMFKMVSKMHPQVYSIVFSSSDMKLIHFYRNTILNAASTDETRTRLFCFGYERKTNHDTHKVIMMITPHDGLVVTEDPNLI